MANRLQNVIQNIVSPDQTGYIKGRFIGHNLRLIQDIIDYSTEHKHDGVLLFLDFQKAFDSVEWDFLFKTLEQFNFGPDFLRWIKIMYTKPTLRIKNNGWLSDSFQTSRGIRQGCPISALLFILVVEIMAVKLKSDPDLKGMEIKLKDKRRIITLSQYADDSTLVLDDITQIRRAIDILTEFGEVAGLKLNLGKTEALLLNSHQSNIGYEDLNLSWTYGPTKCLGIYVGGDKSERDNLNWSGRVDALERVLQTWKSRDLTLFGKITLIKTLGIPKLIFAATNCTIPDKILKNIEKILFSFIWGKRDRIRRKVLYGPIKNGGLNMVDIKSKFEAVKASWLNQIIEDNGTSNWSFIPNALINNIGREVCLNLWHSKINTIPILQNLPEFYQEVLQSFSNATHNFTKLTIANVDRESILDMPLWGNQHIKYGRGKHSPRKPLFFYNWTSFI